MLNLPALVASVVLAQTQPTEIPATQPRLAELRAEHLGEITKEYAQLPHRGPTTIGKILSIALDDGNLHVKSLLEETTSAVVYDAIDWPGWLQVKAGDPQSLNFYMKHIDLNRPNEIATYTTVITGPDYLQINRESEGEDAMSSVTLIQSRQFADESEDPIRLSISKTAETEGAKEIKATYSAANFDQLRRRHAPAVREYLGPILKDLGAIDVLRSSNNDLSWQVLGPDIQTDPALRERLAVLIKKLGADDFTTRAAAEDELATLGAPAATALSTMDLSALSTDARASIETFIRTRQRTTPERIKALRLDLHFLLDTLLLDDAVLQKAAAARIGDLTGKRLDLPTTGPTHDREAAIEALRQQLAPATQPSDE